MALRGRRGGASAREDEPRRDDQAEQQAPAPRGPVLPPPPLVDYGVFMQGLVQTMQTQAHTQAALQAQLEAQAQAPAQDHAMALRGRRGGASAREDEPRHDDQAEQQAPAPRGPVLPPPPLVDYGVFMQGLVQTMQTQAHTQAALQAQLEAQAQAPAQDHGGQSIMKRFKRMTPPSFKGESDPLMAKSWLRETEKIFRAIRCPDEDKVTLATYMLQERADVWWSSLLCTRFEDGAVDVAWDAFVRLFRAKFVPEHIQDKMEQECLSLTQGSMTVLEYEARFSELSKYAPHIVEDERRKTKKLVMGLKPSLRTRLVALDHRTLDEALSAACRQEGEMEQYLEEKKASQKRPAVTFQQQDKKKTVPSVRSPGVKKECPHCGKTPGGSECWLVAGRCLKCGSSYHKIKDCPRLQQGAQRGAPAPAVAETAPATGRPGRSRAPARVFALAREDAEQAEHVTEGVVGDVAPLEETVETDSERGD
ncbi:hypothetical protein Taro_025947 [Colocasia esculenta]|uniref:CCHC-type domain-containing protein n=1 Tax=Colocasia esculenta TaxID=4460 RepID=A0A843VFQ2_COLES|nr:hypothetical protein [Colocasia esculenta]